MRKLTIKLGPASVTLEMDPRPIVEVRATDRPGLAKCRPVAVERKRVRHA